VKGKEWYQADDVAAEYDDKRFSGGGRLIDRREKRAVLDALEPLDGKRILEIACGTGRFSVAVAERGADVTGLDISGPMLAQGREKARAADVTDDVEFIRGDASRLPFPDDHFDAVFAMRFFHLADTPATFLEEIGRVTAGPIVFDTFRRYSARSVYNWALPMGSHLYSRSEVADFVAKAGLTITDEGHDFIVPYGVYRKLPRVVADPIRAVDTALGGVSGDLFASVSYWTVESV
jgi:SAM-dependent methyltransferase